VKHVARTILDIYTQSLQSTKQLSQTKKLIDEQLLSKHHEMPDVVEHMWSNILSLSIGVKRVLNIVKHASSKLRLKKEAEAC
jgi:hypothetical protein